MSPQKPTDERVAERFRLLERLGIHGGARERALEQADAELAAIGKLMPAARAAGLSITDIAHATGVSRPTLYSLQKGRR